MPLSFQAKLCFSVDKTKLLTFYFQIQLWRQNTKVLLLSLWKLLSTSCDHSNVGPSVALSHGTNYLDCSYENQWCCTTTQQRNPPQRYLNGTTIYSLSGRSSNFGVCGEYKLNSSMQAAIQMKRLQRYFLIIWVVFAFFIHRFTIKMKDFPRILYCSPLGSKRVNAKF